MKRKILVRLILTLVVVFMMVALAHAVKEGHPAGCTCCCCGTAAKQAQGPAAEDAQKYPECKYCGMNRQSFAQSRMLIEYNDGSAVGTCSLHCAAIDLMVNLNKTTQAIRVGDCQTKELTDAEKAIWVIGGKKPGVMTKRAKWAFADKKDARTFIKENGGKLANFDLAMKASYEDMYADTKSIREKRARQQQPKPQEPKSE